MAESQISLFLETEDEKPVDLEVAARTALAFARTVKHVAFIIDPSAAVDIKIISGTHGSLSINSVVRALSKDGKVSTRTAILYAIILTVTVWLALSTINYLWEKALDRAGAERILDRAAEIAGLEIGNAFDDLREEEIVRIANQISEVIKRRDSSNHVRDVYEEAARDEAITGVGVSQKHNAKPREIIKRELFARFLAPKVLEQIEERRTREVRESLRIVAPRLIDDGKSWRFIGPGGEFAAEMRDKAFRRDFTRGYLNIDLSIDLNIRATVLYIEKWEDEVWVIQQRAILKVHGYQSQLYQSSFLLEDDQSDD